ncbi:MAG: paraslipin [Mailhella sp.]|nr:paraslipin [Mailhella sp.]
MSGFAIDPAYASILIAAVLIFLLIITLLKSAVVVPNQQAYVIERLGKFHTVLYAGFHLLIPYLDRIAYKRSLKEQVLDVPKQTCITRDNVSVDIDGVLYLQVVSPEKSAYGISDFLVGSVQLAQTALRSAIGKLELDRTFEERSTINHEVIAALDAATAPWGIKVLRYEIRDITPPATVMEAMEKQMRAEREKRAVIAKSEGEKQSQINIAEAKKAAVIAESEGKMQAVRNQALGEKAAAIAESEGRMQAMQNQAQGEAALISIVANATADGLKVVAEQMKSPEGIAASNLKVAQQWIEQYGNIAQKGTTMIIPQNMADIAGMVAAATSVIKKSEPDSGKK